jgi:nicotinamide-nucleotide amidase
MPENIVEIFKKRKLSIAVVESCTAGYFSYLITKTPGSSQIFKGSIIAYSPQIKKKFFQISELSLKKSKGVSEEISLILAKKIRRLFNADVGVSIVGFAGPKSRKGVKVGTVFISIVDKNGAETRKIYIKGSRDVVRKKSSLFLINLLIKKFR